MKLLNGNERGIFCGNQGNTTEKKLLYFITFSKFKQMAIKKIIAFEVDHNRGKWSQIWLLSELAEVLGPEVITRSYL